jgi:putative transposase
MAKKKRHTAAEIAVKLGEAQTLSAAGRTQSEIAKALGISVMTFHRWRRALPRRPASYLADVSPADTGVPAGRGTESGRVSRIAELQLENARLRKLVTDLLLEKMKLEDEHGLNGGGAALKKA